MHSCFCCIVFRQFAQSIRAFMTLGPTPIFDLFWAVLLLKMKWFCRIWARVKPKFLNKNHACTSLGGFSIDVYSWPWVLWSWVRIWLCDFRACALYYGLQTPSKTPVYASQLQICNLGTNAFLCSWSHMWAYVRTTFHNWLEQNCRHIISSVKTYSLITSGTQTTKQTQQNFIVPTTFN